MLQSQLFGKTLRAAPKDEISFNARLLTQAGYIDKLMAGVYNYLPLGLRVLKKIQEIVRQEMNSLGGQEIYMPALQPKELWEETGRWEAMKGVMFQFKGRENKELGLGTTHEEVVVDIARKQITSYRDLPLYLYQIQDKFRNEPRAKSGLLRGREFSMKDLYSFHRSVDDLNHFYQQAISAYQKIFKRLSLKAVITEASGGAFTKDYSHEFQVITDSGEDEIIICAAGDFSQNREICQLAAGSACPVCTQPLQVVKAIEVGNIFKLGSKYSQAMGLTFADEAGKKQDIFMGCYGLGPSRAMGSLVELWHDQRGIIWPRSVTPYQAHLLLLTEATAKKSQAKKLYHDLVDQGWEILFDDRAVSSGVKLNDADLLGLSLQLIIGEKTQDKLEYRLRDGSQQGKIEMSQAAELLKKTYV